MDSIEKEWHELAEKIDNLIDDIEIINKRIENRNTLESQKEKKLAELSKANQRLKFLGIKMNQ